MPAPDTTNGEAFDRQCMAPGCEQPARFNIAASLAYPARYVCAGHSPFAKPATVKAPDLFGVVHDTFATETELNGWKPTQGGLF